MKSRLSLLCLLAVLFCSLPAYAIIARVPKKTDDVVAPPPNPVFTCMPQAFTLTKDDAGYHFHGQVQVPTGGWTYDMDEQEPGPDGSLHGTLHMKEPDGVVTQVISQVAIDHTFGGEGDRLSVEVDGMKDNFKIDCTLAGAAQ